MAHIRGFTRLPAAAPSSRSSPGPTQAARACSLTLATYSRSSVRRAGQLTLRYSNPSVCITAARREGVHADDYSPRRNPAGQNDSKRGADLEDG